MRKNIITPVLLMACTIENNKIAEVSFELDDVTITPDTGVTNDSILTCSVSTSDSNANVTTRFEWMISTTTVGTTDALDLSSVAAVPGDQVTCVATVEDDSGLTASGNASVTVDNRPAVLGSLMLTPEMVLTNDTVTLSSTASDPDILQTVTVNYDWHVVDFETGEDVVVQSGGSNTLDGTDHFDKDDNIYVVATPNDGLGDGTAATSEEITIYNSAPTAPTVRIIPNPAHSVDTLTCGSSPPSSDDDGDAVTYTHKWLVDGVETNNTSNTVAPSQTSFGQNWRCIMTPSDGTIEGQSHSTAITITDYDSDGDGVLDSEDLCEGYDDTLDQNANGLPDDCEVSTIYTFTSTIQTFDVPLDTAAIFIQAYGAKGGDGDAGVTGGFGGLAEATIPVVPGETLEVYVGGAGTSHFSYGDGGFNGGGNVNECCGNSELSGSGGGASDVRISPYTLNDRIIVAGGGGGGGTSDWGLGTGGAGGGLTGLDGTPPSIQTNPNVREGTGGSQSAGGTALQCCGSSYPNENGIFGQGGACWHDSASCGGGGGGWYGGGAGSFAPGGGGSSYVGWPDATNTNTATGTHTGNGQVIITYLAVP